MSGCYQKRSATPVFPLFKMKSVGGSASSANLLLVHYAANGVEQQLRDTSVLPSIWDTLSAANVGCKYYYHDVPFIALYGAKYPGISHLFSDFLSNAAAGTLPPAQ